MSCTREDYVLCGTDGCVINQLNSGGYVFVRVEGWVFANQQPGTRRMTLWWNPERGDNATCGSPGCEFNQIQSGYLLAGTEGWDTP